MKILSLKCYSTCHELSSSKFSDLYYWLIFLAIAKTHTQGEIETYTKRQTNSLLLLVEIGHSLVTSCLLLGQSLKSSSTNLDVFLSNYNTLNIRSIYFFALFKLNNKQYNIQFYEFQHFIKYLKN